MGIIANFNEFGVLGHIVKDAELVTTDKGVKYSAFTVANNSVKKQGENFVQYTNYFSLKVFGKYAEAINPYLKKGQAVLVKGRIEQSRWEANGEKRSAINLVPEKIEFVGNKPAAVEEQPETKAPEVPVEVAAASDVSGGDVNYELF